MSQLDKVMYMSNIIWAIVVFLCMFVVVNEFLVNNTYSRMRILFIENEWKVFEGFWSLKGLEIYAQLLAVKYNRVKNILRLKK